MEEISLEYQHDMFQTFYQMDKILKLDRLFSKYSVRITPNFAQKMVFT